VFLFIQKKEEEKHAHKDHVSIIVITEERRREAPILTSVFFIRTEDRRREAQTRTR
jgi:hypothetical protein